MTDRSEKRVPFLLWPFKALWDLLAFILRLTGRLVAALIGLGIAIVGFILTILVISAPIGIPMMVFGFLLMVRGIF
jgi:hypothetical protein